MSLPFVGPFNGPFAGLFVEQRVRQWIDRFNPDRRKRERAFRALRERFYRELWSTTVLGMGGSLEELGDGFVKVSVRGKQTILRGGEVMLDSHLLWELAGNKPLCHRLLSKVSGYRMPNFATYSLDHLDRAYAFLDNMGPPVVVKPALGPGAGRGVTTGIRDRGMVRQASVHAARYGQSLMIEEQITGASYRLLFLNGELLQAIRRDPPAVTGDGHKTIAELMQEETARRLSSPTPTALSPLEVDLEAKQALHENGMALGDRPKSGKVVAVKRAPNQNAARENRIVTDQVHPCYGELGRGIATALSIELLGLDVLAPDLDRPLADAGGVVGEVNTTPGLHHHYLVAEPNRDPDVAEQVLRYILSGPSRGAAGLVPRFI